MVKIIKPYGLILQLQQVCGCIDGSMAHYTTDFNRLHELDIKVC